MTTKRWYESKLVWLGIVQTLLGALLVLRDALEAGPVNEVALVNIAAGILTVILRVWFTSRPVE